MTWGAGITEDWPSGTVRVFIGNQRPDGHSELLMEDGTWLTVETGTTTDRAGILLPRPALDALLDELTRWKGLATHQATEAKVLREWLAVERERVTDMWWELRAAVERTGGSRGD